MTICKVYVEKLPGDHAQTEVILQTCQITSFERKYSANYVEPEV